MNPTYFNEWSALFFSSLRREASARKYIYKFNLPRIKKLVANRAERQLFKATEANEVPVLLDRSVFGLKISQIQQLLLKDISAPAKTVFKLVRTDHVASPVESWDVLNSLLQHPVVKTYTNDTRNTPIKSLGDIFAFTNIIAVPMAEETLEVVWPDPMFSYFCRGIGVTSEVHDKLVRDDITLINPATKTKLPVFTVKFVPTGYKAIGLFPKFVPEHRSIFKGLDLYGAMVTSKICKGKEKQAVENVIRRKLNAMDGSNDNIVNLLPIFEVGNSTRGENLTLREFINDSKKFNHLWRSSDSRNAICPGDILRATILNDEITSTQVGKEFMVHSVLFNIFSQVWRSKLKMKEYSSLNDDLLGSYQWKPWDSFIWNEFQKIENEPAAFTLEDVILLKNKFDRFLIDLHNYHCIVTSEMKLYRRNFFQDGEQPVARVIPTSLILQNILQHCKWIKVFYPGLKMAIDEQFHTLKDFPSTVVPQDDAVLKMGSRISAIVQEMAMYEQIIYKDDLGDNIYKKEKTDVIFDDWKVVILLKYSLPNDIITTIKFGTRVYVQFVNSLENVTRIAYSKCLSKRMIDEDTFIFLYKLNKEDKIPMGKMVETVMHNLKEGNNLLINN
ncbi:hypothetical protein KAFR_0I01540 [Kazachstania africana CBS 2517]|uniref:Uncharacterized protein n=1 Tax=Kazachstania africana (strain ATCC 22294 / BCRC 22015 / CBS 2517 / CECT 1963 / NBRC 1671 / NRRL Y-8276) TaxID=1071382 RepID=H2AZY5_KAZAF|nr:hypothetical protein KAFR_0I01540 [Kazachstania africana CBS 2517]CCF59935.1 hypothetical protein KAFR_0I01540 [Kazachstania africana CBS 2517]